MKASMIRLIPFLFMSLGSFFVAIIRDINLEHGTLEKPLHVFPRYLKSPSSLPLSRYSIEENCANHLIMLNDFLLLDRNFNYNIDNATNIIN